MGSIDTERAAVRAQILSDQAARADDETHTARTVALGAAQVPAAWTKLGALRQRALFGGVPFGRRAVRLTPRGVEVRRIVDYGRDWNDQDWSYAEIAALLNRGETVVGKKD
jgi:hypothetical protein